MDQTLQRLTMTYYLEARQRADLRRDIAALLFPTGGPFSVGDRVYYWQVDKSTKKKHGTTSGRWFKARVLSQEGAICVLMQVPQFLRVNQSKLRKEKFVDSPTDSLPRERPDVPADATYQNHLAPTNYWTTPQHVTVNVLELSDGLCAFSSVCNQ